MQLRMLMTVHILTEVQYLTTSYMNYSHASSPHKSVADFYAEHVKSCVQAMKKSMMWLVATPKVVLPLN